MHLKEKIQGARRLAGLYASSRGNDHHVPADTKSVVVMPLFGEVAYEVLYWLPFVNQTLRNFSGQVVYWGRDGSENWFQHSESSRVKKRNMFDVIERDWFLRWQSDERSKKHFKQRDFLRNKFIYECLLEASTDESDTEQVHLLAPESMFNLVVPAIADPFGIRWRQIKSNFLHQKITLAQSDFVELLPPRFNTCRLYSKGKDLDFSNVLTQGNVLKAISDLHDPSLPLLDFSPPEDFQDHKSWSPPDNFASSIWNYLPYETSSNLLLQSFIIARSESLFTSHGGLAYLSIALGTPTIAVGGSKTVIYQLHRNALNRMVRHLGTSYRSAIV